MKSLLKYLKNYKKESFCAPLFKMLEACFDLIVPLVVSAIIDNGIKTNDTSYVLKMGGVLVLLAFVGLAFSITAQYFAAKEMAAHSSRDKTPIHKNGGRDSGWSIIHRFMAIPAARGRQPVNTKAAWTNGFIYGPPSRPLFLAEGGG